ncbi:amidohydrolase/deacetylase family metallohydrolase [Reyranella sp.]|uniref:amidohydrolase/deacetylase family metallohydrolase n=1 Tax=Reyranella sp. TaxID=1929291 RepID=UPI002730E83E|nr:amidohydrolase/deacetylase family metallohydrolase [Reyranella sp.]MDP2376147.1 amidohydrolase/deacetylase family metallohydrolase [Reyranella sp.]
MTLAPFDLILRGGHVIDPATGLDGIADVAITDGRIADVRKDLPGAARETLDVRGRLVLPGMIDTHAHIYTYVSGRFGLPADMVGVASGVTTIVDQGGASCMTFPGFRKFIAEPASSRVLSFLSAYVVGGLEGHFYPGLYGPEGVDVAATVKTALANRDLIRGIKVHAEVGGVTRWGFEVLRKAAEIGRAADLPVYMHFGQMWALPEGSNGVDPDGILPAVVELMRPGDILAHPFTRHPGGFVDKHGKLHPIVQVALERGLKVDVGHGSHFSFRMARLALDAGVLPDTLGADMHGYNTRMTPPPGTPAKHPDDEEAHPFAGAARFSLCYAVTELLTLGLTLKQIVPMVTTNAAAMLGLADEIGTLRPGAIADISVLADDRGRFRLGDNEGTEVMADRMLTPLFCLRAGTRHDAAAPILPEVLAA